MRLRGSVRKILGPGVHREVRAEETLTRVWPHLGRFGITRVADITGLDRIGVPVYSAIVPRSRDVVSVYNGKGPTAVAAKVGAIMEAIERATAATPRAPAKAGSYAELAGAGRVLDPRDVNLALRPDYAGEAATLWIEGFDLLSEETVLVPLFLAGYYVRGFPGQTCFGVATTNGIASGNSLEEAVCHALCEVIERDAWTLADLIGHRFSRALAAGDLPFEVDPEAAARFRDRHPAIDPETLPDDVRALLDRFRAAGLVPRLRDVTSDTGVASILCTAAEASDPNLSAAHVGVGTHPDAGVAAIRAITELAQSRAVDIQGVREDLALPDATVDPARLHVKRSPGVDAHGWYHGDAARKVRFSDLVTYEHEDLMDDVRLMLERLRAVGVRRVIAVDLSAPDTPAAVVRVIAPGLESWAIDRSRLGRRASGAWAAALAAHRGEEASLGGRRRVHRPEPGPGSRA